MIFSALEDPRQQCRVVYPLNEILLLVLCATLEMQGFDEIRLWGEHRLNFLRRFYAGLENGIASHDTLNEVMNGLDPDLFKDCITSFVGGQIDGGAEIIAIDGKSSRRSSRHHSPCETE